MPLEANAPCSNRDNPLIPPFDPLLGKINFF